MSKDIQVQLGTVSTEKQSDGSKKSGCFVSVVSGFILTFLIVAIIVGVAIVVHFASPRGNIQCVLPPSEKPGEEPWSRCQHLITEKKMCKYLSYYIDIYSLCSIKHIKMLHPYDHGITCRDDKPLLLY